MPSQDRRRRLISVAVAITAVMVIPLAVVATDVFDDVPDSNVHHDDITWLKEAGVTIGCNPPANDQYCPDDSVTRAQMASFMRRLAENQVVDAASVRGVTLYRFLDQAPTGTNNQEIGTFGPITLYARCSAGNVPTLRASWDETVNHLTFEGSTGALFGNATVNAGSTVDIASGQFGSVGLAEAVGFSTHTHTSVEYFLRRAPALGDNACFFSGFVTVG